jgi:hypothetical protein
MPASTESDVTASEGRLTRDDLPLEVQTITLEQLAQLLGRSARTVRIDATKAPHKLPPLVYFPGNRTPRCRVIDFQRWMEGVALMERTRRQERAEESKRLGAGAERGRVRGVMTMRKQPQVDL